MKRRLTNQQRQAVMKAFCLVLSVALFTGALLAVPLIVGALPRFGGTAAGDFLYGDRAMAETVPTFALGGGYFEESSQEESSEESDFEESIPEEEISVPLPEDGDLFVTESNLCWYEIGETAGLNLNNSTEYSVDLQDYLSREFPIEGGISDSEPLVLIIHTHGTESYLPKGYDFYSPDESFRSEDESRTVVHIGEVLSQRLNQLGITTVHDKTMYDIDDFNQAYYNSYQGMVEALEKYPSIKFVIDLHRDSVFDSEGNNVKPLTTIDGKDCAQLMLVVGTDGYGTQPNWQSNLTFATYLQQKMNDLYPTLARPISLSNSGFNQRVSEGSIIVEAGACGNTVEEAENAILCFAEAYAELLKEQLQ